MKAIHLQVLDNPWEEPILSRNASPNIIAAADTFATSILQKKKYYLRKLK